MENHIETIIGVDPGYARLGYGVICHNVKNRKIKALDFGVLETKPSQLHPDRLLLIQRGIKKIIKKYKPDILAIEKIFFAKNQKTVILVAESRGVVLCAAAEMKIRTVEFTPLEVKNAVTGAGRADKREIQEMVKILCSLSEIPRSDDAADALANALTYTQHSNFSKIINRYR